MNERQDGEEGKEDNLEDEVHVDKAWLELSHSVNHQRSNRYKNDRDDDRNDKNEGRGSETAGSNLGPMFVIGQSNNSGGSARRW